MDSLQRMKKLQGLSPASKDEMVQIKAGGRFQRGKGSGESVLSVPWFIFPFFLEEPSENKGQEFKTS